MTAGRRHDFRARTVADAVQATKMGAFEFLEKPLARDRVLLVVKNATEWGALQRENSDIARWSGSIS